MKHFALIIGLAFTATFSVLEISEAASKWSSGSSTPDWRKIRTSQSSRAKNPYTRKSVTPFSPGSNNVSIDIGQVLLMGDLTDYYTNNLGFRTQYTYGVSDIFAFNANLGFSEHGDDFSMALLTTGMRINLAWFDRIVPYGIFGLGFYNPTYKERVGGTKVSVSPVLFGLHLGPGVNLLITDSIYFGSSLTFHSAFTTTKKIPLTDRYRTVGGTFTSFLLHAGLSF